MKASYFGNLLAALILLFLFAVIGHDQSYSRSIVDVSWPNCKTEPKSTFQIGIIGVNGGLDFHANPCLAKETSWFGRYALYINTGYPGKAYGRRYQSFPKKCGPNSSKCLAYNYGFNAALYSTKYAALQNAHASLWWLDVELINSWTPLTNVNREFLKGAADEIKQDNLFATVGVYSSPNQWNIITGNWHNNVPAWLATGSETQAQAKQACGIKPFTGGSIWLSQYTNKLDVNATCNNQFIDHLNGAASNSTRITTPVASAKIY